MIYEDGKCDENFGLSLDLFYHSSYNNEEYERDMEEEY